MHHQQQRSKQLIQCNLSPNGYGAGMPVGYSDLFIDAKENYNTTRLCVQRTSK